MNLGHVMAKRIAQGMVLLFFASLVAVVPAVAEQPLATDDITLLLLGGASNEKIIALVEQRGVNFQMNPDLAKKFHDRGASDELIEALQKAGAKAGAVPPSAPSATPQAASGQTASTGRQAAPSAPASIEQKVAETLAGISSRPSEDEYPLAPAFSLRDLNGQKLDLADYRGKAVLLNFWATWCPQCRRVIPSFIEFQDRYRDRGFQVIGISVDDSPKPVQKFYQQHNMNYPVAMCDSATRRMYGPISGIPTIYLIGRDGRIRDEMEGAPVDMASFEERVMKLLAAPVAEEAGGRGQAAGSNSAGTTPTGTAESKPSVAQAPPTATTVSAGTAAGTQPASAPARPAGATALTDPSPDQVQRIIQEFAGREKLFREARNNYTYHQINKVQELGPDDDVVGVFEQEWDILYDDNGKRIERVTYAPVDTLKRIGVTKEDLDAMRNIQPFVLTTDEVPEYDIKYLGHVVVPGGELTTYVFSIRPKELKKGRQYFQGVVWVDDRDLQIVLSEGKSVPELKTKKGENLFPRFKTYREQIDGKYWFPTFTMADDTLYFSSGPVRIRQILRYTDYKQFKSKVRILSATPTDEPSAPPTAPPKNPQ